MTRPADKLHVYLSLDVKAILNSRKMSTQPIHYNPPTPSPHHPSCPSKFKAEAKVLASLQNSTPFSKTNVNGGLNERQSGPRGVVGIGNSLGFQN